MLTDRLHTVQGARSIRTSVLCFLFVLTAFLHSGCSDEGDVHYPSLVTEFAEVFTDNTGAVYSFVNDKGKAFVPRQKITTERPDTVLRCICRYAIGDSDVVDVYGVEHVYSQYPFPADSVKNVSVHPVNMRSVWKSGGYINMHLGFLTTGVGKHTFGFVLDSISSSAAEGKSIVYASLFHNRPDEDDESYTEKVYMSMPIGKYVDSYDSIQFSVLTYDGIVKRTFPLSSDSERM